MKKQLHYLIAGIAVLLFTTAFFNNASGQVINSESFNTLPFLPPGWTPVGNINNWSRQTNGTNPTCTPHSGAGMARFNRNAPANAPETFCSPRVDYSSRGVDTPSVSFWVYRDGGFPTSTEVVTLYVNHTPTMTAPVYLGSVARSRSVNLPDTQAVNGWYQYTFRVMDATFNTGTNYILVSGSNDVSNGNNIFIDDIQYESFPTACSGPPTPGNIVPTDTVVCGGSGSTILNLAGQQTDTGITFQWKYSLLPGGPWTDFGTSTPSVPTGTITATTYYYAVLTCIAAGVSDSTPVVHVAVDAGTAPIVSVTASNNGFNCASAPVILTASGATFYSWSPATGLDTTVGSVVHAAPAGNPGFNILYTVRGANAAGCFSTDSVLVTNHSTTTATIQALPGDTICTGQQLTLNAQPSMGPMITDYLWTGGATTQSITVSPSTNGTYSVTVTNNWGCIYSDSIPIVIVPGTVPVITSLTSNPTPALYCNGGPPVILQATGTGGTIYTWTPANGLNTTSGDSVLAAPQGGFGPGSILYTVTLTSASGCSAFDTIRVTRQNRPTVFPTATSDSVCSGDSTTLDAVVFGMNDTFLWMPGGFTTQSITVAPSANQLYTVHVVSGTTGCSRDTSIQIAVTPGPVAAFGYTVAPGTRTVTFQDNSSNGTGYLWLFGDGNQSTLPAPQYTYAVSDTFVVRQIITNGNCSPDTAYATIIFTVGIDEPGNAEIISISPNPTDNIAVVQFRATTKVTLQVVNSLGEVVSERTINANGNNIQSEKIDMHNLAAGIYMIHIISGQNNFSRKLVKY